MIKIAEKSDIEDIACLRVMQQKDIWKDKYNDKYDLYNKTKEYLNVHLNIDLIIFVKEVDSKIIANCSLQIIKFLPQCNDNGLEGCICNVYTKEEYRNQGIQTKLIKECIKYAKKEKIAEIQLWNYNSNESNIYSKVGFIKDDFIMKLNLNEF